MSADRKLHNNTQLKKKIYCFFIYYFLSPYFCSSFFIVLASDDIKPQDSWGSKPDLLPDGLPPGHVGFWVSKQPRRRVLHTALSAMLIQQCVLHIALDDRGIGDVFVCKQEHR